MRRRLLLITICGLLLAALIPGVTAQNGGCAIDFARLQALMTQAETAMAAGDVGGALAALNALGTTIEQINTACGGGMNWCNPGQPWGDGRCNADSLTLAQVEWFWTCGWHWAQFVQGNIDAVPGFCGGDRDGDGIPDDDDACPDQGGNIDASGCPTASDGPDLCPLDPLKTAPGACGCGTPDVDTDGDGTLNCVDLCPADPGKVVPGVCGCGTPDVDSDSDGTLDCFDGCPLDPAKIAPGACGCGAAETDSDSDGTPDCIDGCPANPGKTAPGVCGCGLPESSNCDGDSLDNSTDLCPLTFGVASCDGCPQGCSGPGCAFYVCLYGNP